MDMICMKLCFERNSQRVRKKIISSTDTKLASVDFLKRPIKYFFLEFMERVCKNIKELVFVLSNNL